MKQRPERSSVMWRSQREVKKTCGAGAAENEMAFAVTSLLIIASGLPSYGGKSLVGKIHHFSKVGTRLGTDTPQLPTGINARPSFQPKWVAAFQLPQLMLQKDWYTEKISLGRR